MDQKPGFIIPLLGLVALLLVGSAAFAVAGADVNVTGQSTSFGYVSSDEIYSGANMSGGIKPPVDPKLFARYNGTPHGAAGHGIFKITCRDSGAVDYFPANNSVTMAVYAVADGEVAAARKTYKNKNGNTGSILELRHSGNPSCSTYAHIEISTELEQQIEKIDPSYGGEKTIVIPANGPEQIQVQAGHQIGVIAHPRTNFSAHLHFQLAGATESQLQQAMQQLHNSTVNANQ